MSASDIAVKDLVLKIQKRVNTQYKQRRIKATGKFERTQKIIKNKSGYSLEIISYGRYLEDGGKGRPPTRPGRRMPASALDRWFIIKGKGNRDSQGRFVPRKQATFAIARSIDQKGYKKKRGTGIEYERIAEEESRANLVPIKNGILKDSGWL